MYYPADQTYDFLSHQHIPQFTQPIIHQRLKATGKFQQSDLNFLTIFDITDSAHLYREKERFEEIIGSLLEIVAISGLVKGITHLFTFSSKALDTRKVI